MQVSVETITGLERRMTVEVPAARIEQEVKSRLKTLASRAKFDGFRPGKVPFTVVERKFAGKVRAEVLGDMIRSTFHEAIMQEKLRPAGGPQIKTLYEESDKGLGYTATFEVYPEIRLAPVDTLKIDKPSAEITEQDVDTMLETLRKQRPKWTPVEREVRHGDQLQVEFATHIEGQESHGRHAQQTTLVLGSSAIEKAIEEKLLGAKIGEEIVIEHRLPADFHDQTLANKPAHYSVKIMALYEPELRPLDEEFVRTLGVESGAIGELRNEVRDNMQRELDQTISNQLKQDVMEALFKANPLELPKALVDKETVILSKQNHARQVGRGAQTDLLQDSVDATARRRVALGLLLGDIVKTAQIKADPARTQTLLETMASTYEDPDEVIKWYRGSEERLAQIESLALEDQVVNWIIERAQVSRRDSTFDALMHPQQTTQA